MAACSSRRNRSASHRRHQGSAAAPWHRKANRATHRPGPGEYNGKPTKRHVGLHVAGEQLSTSSMSKDDGRWPCLGGTTASRWSGSIGFHRPASCRGRYTRCRSADRPGIQPPHQPHHHQQLYQAEMRNCEGVPLSAESTRSDGRANRNTDTDNGQTPMDGPAGREERGDWTVAAAPGRLIIINACHHSISLSMRQTAQRHCKRVEAPPADAAVVDTSRGG